MPEPSIAVRLGVTGNLDEGKRQIVALGDAGDAQAQRLARGFEKASDDVEAALQRQARAAAKISAIAPQSAVQMRVNDTVGTGFGQYEGSAKASALAFRELIAEQERMEEKARAIRAALDPLAIAQDRYNRELAEARTLMAAGALSADDLVAHELRLKNALDQATSSAARNGASLGQRRAGFQQLGFQIGDVTAQAANGTSALVILAQQGGQVAQSLELIGGAGKMGAFLKFIGGPWGQIILAGVTILSLFGDKILGLGDDSEKTSAKMRALGVAEDGLGSKTLSVAAATAVLNKAQLQDTTANIAANARSAAEARTKQAEATFKAASAEAQIRLAQAKARVADVADGEVRDGRTVRKLDTTQTRAGTELYREQTVAAKELAAAQTAIDNLENGMATSRRTFARQAVEQDQSLVEARAKLAVSTSAVARAEAQRNIDDARSKALRDTHQISEVEYQRRIEATAGKVEAARTAEQRLRETRKESAKDTREYATALKGLIDGFDPFRTPSDAYSKALKNIDEAEQRGGASSEQAAEYRARALEKFKDQVAAAEKAAEDARQRGVGDILGEPGGIASRVSNDDDAIAARTKSAEGAFSKQATAALDASIAKTKLLREEGQQLFDTAFNPDNWKSWGAAGKAIIADLKSELIKLALINPLKNAIFGGSLPSLGSLFGGTTPASSAPITYTASGTDFFSGGMTWLAENGPEIVNLPRGSRVTPASDTRRLLAANDSGGDRVENHFHLEGAVVTQDLLDQMNAIGDSAATRGAYGGAALSQLRAGKRARRTIRG